MNPGKSSRYAWCCGLALPLIALLVWPVLEQGVSDDWSYDKTVQILARTGHFVYNGWVTAMGGWQLYLGALAVHVFGFSFTAIRLSMLPVAALTAWLMQRCFVRAGLTERNATAGTLAVMLSPVCLPLSFTFMTDVPGLLVILLCFYCCLRVLGAESARARVGWLVFALVSNAVGGTVRQIAWFGTLLMVPCLMILLRRQRAVLLTGLLGGLASASFMVWVTHWFRLQPNVPADPILPGTMYPAQWLHLRQNLIASAAVFSVFLLPVSVSFLSALTWRGQLRRSRKIAITLMIAALAAAATAAVIDQETWKGLFDTLIGNVVTPYGVLDAVPIFGPRPVVVPALLRVAIAFLAIFSLLSAAFVAWKRPRIDAATNQPALGGQLLMLLGPFSLLYLLCLLPRAAFVGLFDRYLIPLLCFAVLGLLRLWQSRVAAELPWRNFAVIGLFAAFAIAATHDFFAQYRARQLLVHQLNAAGVNNHQIDGGMEFNAWVEVEQAGIVADARLPGAKPFRMPLPGDRCAPFLGYLMPHIERRFALATVPDACDGEAPFPPVVYRTWLPPFQHTIFVVRDHGTYDGN